MGIVLLTSCAGSGSIREPMGGSMSVRPETAMVFHQRAEIFYLHLVQRRFNTLETFNDTLLREHFSSEDLFFDYYADVAQSLADAHFEKSRPAEIRIEEFIFEDPDHVTVQVKIVGADGRPLRPGSTTLIREDRWEKSDGTWWIIPGRL
jgi:hypothetical protein